MAEDMYLLEASIHGKKLREYVKLKGYQLVRIGDPCPRDIVELLCEYANAGRIALRDAVDVIAYSRGVKRGDARRFLQELVAMGCLRIDNLGYVVVDYCKA